MEIKHIVNSMSSTLRRRVPFSERTPLLETFEVEEAEEVAAEGLFASIEEAAASLDLTPLAPVGLWVGGLAALGYGAYEIYEHLLKSKPKITLRKVEREHKKAVKALEKEKFDLETLEDQHGDVDIVPIEQQNIEGEKAGLVPAPYKYAGPGNSLNRGPAYDLVDESARQHDIAYDKAKSPEDIHKADRQFLTEAGNYVAEGIAGKGSISQTLGGIVTGAGIGIKHLAEKATGNIIYPPMAPPKRGVADSSSGGTPAKQAVTLIPGPSSADAGMTLTGTGKDQASGGASSDGLAEYHIERPISLFGSKISTYRKVHKFMTFGFAPKILSSESNSNSRWLTTYLAEVPWHIPCFYLTPSEFNLLPIGSRVKDVSIQVIYRGSTIQFETASSATSLATLNQINDIAVATALNKTGYGSNVSFTEFTTGKPMIPSKIAKPRYKPIAGKYRGMVADFYGTNNNDPKFDSYIPKHHVGRQCNIYNYAALSDEAASDTDGATNNSWGGWVCLAKHIQQMDGKTCVNQVVLSSTYSPRMGMIKNPLKSFGRGLPQPNAGGTMNIVTQGNLVAARGALIMKDNSVSEPKPGINGDRMQTSEILINLSNDNDGLYPQVDDYDIYTPIEKSQISRSGFWGAQDPHIMPSMHIGVQPVPALSSAALILEENVFDNWTDTRAYWEVIATMNVIEHTPTELPYASVPNVPPGEVVVSLPSSEIPQNYIDPENDHAPYAGLYKTFAGDILPRAS